MKDATRRLWKNLLAGWVRIFVFFAVAIAVIWLLPEKTPARIADGLRGLRDQFKENYQGLYDFFTGRDMEKALPEYEEFK